MGVAVHRPPRRRRTWEVEAPLVLATVVVAAATFVPGTRALLVIFGLAAFVGLVALLHRAPHAGAAALVVLACAQGILLFYVSPYFGPAKDALVLAMLTATGWAALERSPESGPRVDAWLISGIFTLFGLYLVNVSGHHGSAWISSTRLTVEAFGLLIVGYAAPDPQRTWRWSVRALMAMVVINTVLGLVQQAFGVDRLVHQWGYEFGTTVRITSGGSLRSFGTFADPFSYAVVLTVALVIGAFAVRGGASALLSAVAIVGIAASMVRTEMLLVSLVALVWMVWSGRGLSAMALVAAVGVLGVTLALQQDYGAEGPPTSIGTLNGRTGTWRALINGPTTLLAGRGVGETGTGLARTETTTIRSVARYEPGKAPPVIRNGDIRSVDSSYVAVIADVGIAGLALLLALFGRMIALVRPGLLARSPLAWTIAGLTLVLAFDGLTRSSLTAWPNGFLTLFLLGAALGAEQMQARDSGTRPVPRPAAHRPVRRRRLRWAAAHSR